MLCFCNLSKTIELRFFGLHIDNGILNTRHIFRCKACLAITERNDEDIRLVCLLLTIILLLFDPLITIHLRMCPKEIYRLTLPKYLFYLLTY